MHYDHHASIIFMRTLRIKLRPFACKANILTIELLPPPTHTHPFPPGFVFYDTGMGHEVPKLLPSVSRAQRKALISSPVLTKAVKIHCEPGRPHHPHQNATLLSCIRSKSCFRALLSPTEKPASPILEAKTCSHSNLEGLI